MELLSLQKFHQLIQHKADPCLSIYLPTVKAGRETRQNPIRLKNLLSDAKARLEEKGMKRTDLESFLKPVQEVLDDKEYWQKQEKGLAVFLTENLLEFFRLPLEFEPRMVLDSRFHVKPLLPLFLENERFYLLALSQKNLRLFTATRFDLVEKQLPDTPSSLDEALRYDDPERHLHYQSGATGSKGDGMIFHGHHPENDQVSNLKRYFHLVSQGLMAAIGDRSDPLVLAGLDNLHPLFRQVNTYQPLLEEGVYSNADQLDLDQLHQKAWEIVEKRIVESRSQDLERYHSLDNDRKSESLAEVLPAAYHARLDSLFLDLEREAWGRYDPEQDLLKVTSREDLSSRDLIDLTVIHTLLNGGSVQILTEEEFGGLAQSGVAAIFRY